MIFAKKDADFQDLFLGGERVHNEKLAGYLKESVRKIVTNTHVFINKKVKGLPKCIDYPSSLRVTQTCLFSEIMNSAP